MYPTIPVRKLSVGDKIIMCDIPSEVTNVELMLHFYLVTAKNAWHPEGTTIVYPRHAHVAIVA